MLRAAIGRAVRPRVVAPRVARCESRRALALKSTAIKYSKFGPVEQALEQVDEDLPELKPTDVLVRMLAAPINPADLNMIEGVYNIRPPLPAVGGNEGVAEVVEAGAQVSDLQKGDWVLPAAPGFGTWRTLAVAPAASFIRVRSDIPAEYAATVSVNPCTAYRMLRDFVALKPGDVIMQNGSNSAVGVAVIQLARRMRVRTINIIRDRPDLSYVLSRLTSWGADLVFTEDEIRGPKAREALAKLPKPVLGLNCVGGTSAAEVARLLADGAQLITYGGMSRKPVTVPTGTLIFNDIVVRGFWMSRWIATHSRAERSAMLDDLLEMIHNGELEANIETVPFARFSDALLRSKQGYRTHKVVLKFE